MFRSSPLTWAEPWPIPATDDAAERLLL